MPDLRLRGSKMEEMRDGGDLIPWMDGLPVRTIRVEAWVALGTA